jgi:prepilin-type N-terminal cleavage/methylation domain-containing protein
MILHQSIIKGNSQKGFTLVELLIAIAIAAIIMGGIATTFYQIFSVQAGTTNRMYAIRQVQNVGYWVSLDAQNTQSISLVDDINTTEVEFMVFNWVEWNGNEFIVRYVIFDNGDMYRYEYEDSVETSSLIAEDITSCEIHEDGGLLIMTVTAEVGSFKQASETRIYEVVPRSIL